MPSVIRGSDGFDSGAGIRPIAEYQVTGAAVQQIDFNGLDMAAHGGRYDIECMCINADGAAPCLIGMFANGDNTETNYWRQYMQGSGTVVYAGRSNDGSVMGAAAGGRVRAQVFLTIDPDGFLLATSHVARYPGSNIDFVSYAWSKTAAVTNVTSITFKSNLAAGFGVGTRIRIYRRAA